MSEEQANSTGARERPPCPATIALLVINAVVFMVQKNTERHHPGFPIDDYFALSLSGLRHGYIWQLLTFQFMHAGIWHIVFNCWAIFVFGRAVEISLGMKRMLGIYFASGVMGGLVQMLGTLLLPRLFGDGGVVGASAGVFGLVASFSVLYPLQKLYLLLFFIIPLKLKANTLLWLCVGLSVFGILFPLFADRLPVGLAVNIYGFLGTNVAHAAHLGGIIAGYALTWQLIRRYRARAAAAARTTAASLINASPEGSLKVNPAQE